LAETLHLSVEAWKADDDSVKPDDFAKALLGWAESASSDDT
jgi:hypothetical protein